jgi:hypothetical protein
MHADGLKRGCLKIGPLKSVGNLKAKSRCYNLLLESCRMAASALVPLVLAYNNFLLSSKSSIKAVVCLTIFLLQTGLLYRRSAHNLVINHISLFLVATCFWSLGHL